MEEEEDACVPCRGAGFLLRTYQSLSWSRNLLLSWNMHFSNHIRALERMYAHIAKRVGQ
jgi:hypothetical protein